MCSTVINQLCQQKKYTPLCFHLFTPTYSIQGRGVLDGIHNSHILLKYPVVPNFTHWVHILFHSKIKNRMLKKL